MSGATSTMLKRERPSPCFPLVSSGQGRTPRLLRKPCFDRKSALLDKIAEVQTMNMKESVQEMNSQQTHLDEVPRREESRRGSS